MANNGFTELFADGAALTQAKLETALQTLALDISNTNQMTTGTTSGTFLQSQGSGTAAAWASIPDPLGPFAIRNYGLAVSASSGTLKVSLKGNNGSDPAGANVVDIPFSTNGSASATYTDIQVTAPLSITVPVSATLGVTGTSTQRVFVYAINNAGTPRLALSSRSDFDTGAIVATSNINSNTAISQNVMYATSTLNVVSRLLGWFDGSHNASLQWQASSKVNISNNTIVTNYNTANNIYQTILPRGSGFTATAKVGQVAISSSSVGFSTSSTVYGNVTNLSVTITTQGRPVELKLIPDGIGAAGLEIHTSSTIASYAYIGLARAGSTVSEMYMHTGNLSANTFNTAWAASSICFVDIPPSGTYTYVIQAKVQSNTATFDVANCKLFAYEI